MTWKLVLIIIVVVLAAGGIYVYTSATKPPVATEPDLTGIFQMAEKTSSTTLYYSKALGVGFTYALDSRQAPTGAELKTNEIGTKIYLHYSNEKPEEGQSVEVFQKDPAVSFADAISQKLLAGYDPKKCFVVTETSSIPGYAKAEISFPPNPTADGPWFGGAAGCPADYSQTNGVQYFLANPAVPGKYIFVKMGQYSIASDGHPISPDYSTYQSWERSVRIVE